MIKKEEFMFAFENNVLENNVLGNESGEEKVRANERAARLHWG